MIGQEKFSIIIAEKGQKLIEQLVPNIIKIASTAGIENIGQPNEKLPDSCLPHNGLLEILSSRNQLVEQINNTIKHITLFSKSTEGMSNYVNTTSSTLDNITNIRKASNVALNFIPSPPGTPGVLIATLNNLKELEDLLLPKILVYKNIISSIANAIDYINKIFLNFFNLFKTIDKYLNQCGVNDNLTTFDDYLINLNQNQQLQQNTLIPSIYKGFTLEIVEEPFSPTIKRKVGVAKNPQGIILLQTPPSFTTIPQVLIEDLKLLIDSNNLKAN